jgi:hypothetical protein
VTRTVLVAAASALAFGCTVGEGEGFVRSEKLFVEDCWNGPFDLQPTFFAANPFNDTMMIRIQRGEESVEVSDGMLIIINDVKAIRDGGLGTDKLAIGLPPGVSPIGVPERVNLEPPKVSLSLYLYDTCHVQNSALYAVEGSIQFESLFSGDPNEDRAEDRLTKASFRAQVVDPRDVEISDGATLSPGGPALGYPPDRVSEVVGDFEFYFQRGVPAQPFP